jgi:hypothetical protein
MSLFNFILGGMMATTKPAQKDMVGKERTTKLFALRPTKTTTGTVWLKHFNYVEKYDFLYKNSLGWKVYGWQFIENRKLDATQETKLKGGTT